MALAGVGIYGTLAVLLVAAAILLAGALVAAWAPARRAVRIAPMDALRQE